MIESVITVKPFRFWCQKVLPLVYDDSLSYYELLCKVVDYINGLLTDDTNVIAQVNELTTFVNDYFTNLDVQEEINNKLDDMVENGQLDEVISHYVDPYIAAQNANIEAFKTTVNSHLAGQDSDINVLEARMDTFASLPSGGLSTDADAELADIRVGAGGTVYSTAGNAVRGQVSELKTAIQMNTDANVQNLKNYSESSIAYIKTDGDIVASQSWECFKLNAEEITGITYVKVWGTSTAQVAVAFYDSEVTQDNTTLISTVAFKAYDGVSEYDGLTIPEGTKVIAIANRKTTDPNSVITGMIKEQFATLKSNVEGLGNQISLNSEKINDVTVQGKNLFNKNTITENAYLRTNGTVATDTTDYSASDYIPVDGSTVYTCACLNVCFYDSTKTFISFNNTSLPTFTTPSNASYARITILNTAVATGQFEKGSAETGYQPYGYYVPSERILDNDVTTKTVKTVGVNGDFAKLTDGLKYCREYGNVRLLVDSGTYDIIEELGEDFFNNYTGYTDSDDMNIGNDCEYIFAPDSYVQCVYTGSNTNVGSYFCPFNSLSSGHGNFVIDGLNLYTAGCRYAIHDDISGTADFETHIYKNCNIQCSSRCIGAGFGKNMHVEILDSVFWNRGGTRSVAWHNCSTEGKNYLLVSGCYFYGTNNTLELVDYGSYIKKTEVIAHNNSVLAEIYHDVSATYPNIQLRDWNNEIRTA